MCSKKPPYTDILLRERDGVFVTKDGVEHDSLHSAVLYLRDK